jgi:hypothetical protein
MKRRAIEEFIESENEITRVTNYTTQAGAASLVESGWHQPGPSTSDPWIEDHLATLSVRPAGTADDIIILSSDKDNARETSPCKGQELSEHVPTA